MRVVVFDWALRDILPEQMAFQWHVDNRRGLANRRRPGKGVHQLVRTARAKDLG